MFTCSLHTLDCNASLKSIKFNHLQINLVLYEVLSGFSESVELYVGDFV